MPRQKLVGIKGWLAFFVVLLVLSAVISLISTLFFLARGANLIAIPLIIASILFIVSLVLIAKKKKQAKTFVIITVIFSYVLNLIFASSMFSVSLTDAQELANQQAQSLSAIVGLIITIIWIAYFLTSKRVKNTFVK
jgi:Mn2+/Fe2+ NRAMP family transporter